MNVRRILASLAAGLLMSGVFVALTAPAANGLRLVQATCNGSAVQNWQFLQVGDRCQPNCSFSVPLFWIQNQDTGECMDLNNGSSVNGTPVQQWSCVDNTNMKWALTPNPHNLRPQDNFTVTNERAGTCLDVTDGSVAEFAPLHGYHCFDYPNNVAQMYHQA